jgi:regulator of replication initiation timing
MAEEERVTELTMEISMADQIAMLSAALKQSNQRLQQNQEALSWAMDAEERLRLENEQLKKSHSEAASVKTVKIAAVRQSREQQAQGLVVRVGSLKADLRSVRRSFDEMRAGTDRLFGESLNCLSTHFGDSAAKITDLERKYSEEREMRLRLTTTFQRERKILHNTILDMKGNIRVFCRVRGLTEEETQQQGVCGVRVHLLDGCNVGRHVSTGDAKKKFAFDAVFDRYWYCHSSGTAFTACLPQIRSHLAWPE